ncbi:DUF4328 domain-containing protein [Streptomyces sp. p1417]|uniref:DUF4328 domain-containing protein n=1 Tax=Streptomyces typhae TaxID=2681492 RepID=A0A6L6WSX1_9ACTN|nr:DUF4328 domain-containing protein [Streptomyces typhae]
MLCTMCEFHTASTSGGYCDVCIQIAASQATPRPEASGEHPPGALARRPRLGCRGATALVANGVVFLVWFHRVRVNAEVFEPCVHRKGRGWTAALGDPAGRPGARRAAPGPGRAMDRRVPRGPRGPVPRGLRPPVHDAGRRAAPGPSGALAHDDRRSAPA